MPPENWGRRMEILRELALRRAAGSSPSIRELGGSVGLTSTKSIHGHLVALREHGYVTRGPTDRSFDLTEKGWDRVGEMPSLGRIAAGAGIEAVAQDDVYSLVTELAVSRSGRRRFVLKASGHSMTGAGIEDGDELIVEEDESPPDGAVVAALIWDEQVTVKRLYREEDAVRLAAANPDYDDIVVPAEELRVQGRVVTVIHAPRK